jgi:ribonuclease HI/exonuclease III
LNNNLMPSSKKTTKASQAVTPLTPQGGNKQAKAQESQLQIHTLNIRKGLLNKITEIAELIHGLPSENTIWLIQETGIAQEQEGLVSHLIKKEIGGVEVVFSSLTEKEMEAKYKAQKEAKIERLQAKANKGEQNGDMQKAQQARAEVARLNQKIARGYKHRCQGVMTIHSEQLALRHIDTQRSQCKRRLTTVYKLTDGRVVKVHNIYAPSNGSAGVNNFNNQWIQALEGEERDITIAGGDANATWDSDIDRKGEKAKQKRETDLRYKLAQKKLSDVFRHIHPRKHVTTWTNDKVSARLDSFWMRNDSLQLVTSCEATSHTEIDTDHTRVSVVLNLALDKVQTPLSQERTLYRTADLSKSEWMNFQKAAEQEWLANPPMTKEIKDTHEQIDAALDSINATIKGICDKNLKTFTTTSTPYGKEPDGERDPKLRVLAKNRNKARTAINSVNKWIDGYADETDMKRVKEAAAKAKQWIQWETQQESLGVSLTVLKETLKSEYKDRKREYNKRYHHLKAGDIATKIDKLQEQGDQHSTQFYRKITGKFRTNTQQTAVLERNEKGEWQIVTGEASKDSTERYWHKLFNKQYSERDWKAKPAWLQETITPKLNIDQDMQIEFNEMDLQKTAKGMRSKKAPGEDNIPVEIFKNLPTIAWKDITNLFNAMIRMGYIPDKLKKGKVFTIYKGGNDKDIDNFRGITLLNTMYKIMLKALTEITANILEAGNFFDGAQAGARKGRSTHQHLVAMTALLHDSKKHNKEVHLLYLDIRKCFDTISHQAVSQTMEAIGLPTQLQRILNETNRGKSIEILTPYGSTNPIPVNNGLPQGSGLSPLMCIMVLNPMIKWISQSPGGYTMHNNHEAKLNTLAFIDDIVVAADRRQSMEARAHKIECFANYYGIEFNQSKSAYTYRCQQVQPPLHLQGKTVETLEEHQSYRYLGIWVNLDLNWEKQIAALNAAVYRVLTAIRRKCITPDQKIHCINVLVNTKIAYAATVVPMESSIREWQKQIAQTVRGAIKIHNCPEQALYEKRSKGGRGLINLSSLYDAIKVTTLLDYGLNAPHDTAAKVLATTSFRTARTDKDTGLVTVRIQPGETGKNKTADVTEQAYQAAKRISPELQFSDNSKQYKTSTAFIRNCLHQKYRGLVDALELTGIIQVRQVQDNQGRVLQHHQLPAPTRELISQQGWIQVTRALCQPNTSVLKKGLGRRYQRQKDKGSIQPVDKMHPDWREHIQLKKDGFTIKVWTDGSAIKQGKAKMAGAGVVFDSRSDHIINEAFRITGRQTNNNAELQAIERAIRRAPEGFDLEVRTDSQSSIDAITNCDSWTGAQWKAAPNREVIKRVQSLIHGRERFGGKVSLVKVKAHSGIRGNEMADALAAQGTGMPISKGEAPQTEAISITHKNEAIQANKRKYLEELAGKARTQEWKQKSSGEARRAKDISKSISHDIFIDQHRSVQELKNFIMKARLKMLPTRYVQYNIAQRSKSEIHKKVHNSPNCRWCPDQKEEGAHIWKCPKYREKQAKIKRTVAWFWENRLPDSVAAANIPSWFGDDETEDREAKEEFWQQMAREKNLSETAEKKLLAVFTHDRALGNLGIIPEGLLTMISIAGVTGKSRICLLKQVNRAIMKHTQEVWKLSRTLGAHDLLQELSAEEHREWAKLQAAKRWKDRTSEGWNKKWLRRMREQDP